ncbi:MAG: amidohydrolase family protein [Firmicutes bacterium]|nr:amidohydrolase family protein [Bacillota bacterium]
MKTCDMIIDMADQIIDGQGMVALPGFVDTHVHCLQSLLKGLGADLPLIQWLNSSVQPFGIRLTHREQELATLIACLEALKGGCTTMCEFFYTNQTPELADTCIEAMETVMMVTAGLMALGGILTLLLKDKKKARKLQQEGCFNPAGNMVYCQGKDLKGFLQGGIRV